MADWLDAINTLAPQAMPAVLVTVASVDGSAPREAGAKMLVTPHAQFDTIGGGHLEMRASEIAREMMQMPASLSSAERRFERFALGPSLGQCCGGVVHLAFERLDQSSSDFYKRLHEYWRNRQDCWRLVSLDTQSSPTLVDRDGPCFARDAQNAPTDFDHERACHLMKDARGNRWLVDPCIAYRAHLILFGAGHVGAALVRALAALPCQVTWVDERDDIFPADVPANVKIEATDTPEAVVDEAPPGTSYLVMTHNHAIDLRLCEAILRRDDIGWFGLIGSKTKRMHFERRLCERDIAPERLADMACPIGVSGISGKAPAVIAASVCAQLLQIWEAADRTRQACDRPTAARVFV